MSLYLKYRPQTVDELDLTDVRRVLNEMVAANRMAHAYLLTGPRGAGKTSTARIIARIANCEKNTEKLGEPCNKCGACQSILQGSAVDVIEMDGASNRGIDDIRELKQKIRLSPAVLRNKVYIIDEVHMLTNEAFNALLKTLEEPPTHSIFVLCTTEAHKVPETIISRCVQIKFTKATKEELLRSLSRVVAGEGRDVAPEALAYLAIEVDGSFRDGVKVLDQVLLQPGKIDLGSMEAAIAGKSGVNMGPLLESLVAKDTASALKLLEEIRSAGVNMPYLLLQLMRGLRDRMIAGKVGVEAARLIFTLDDVARRQASSLDGELLIQTAIVEWCGVPASRSAERGGQQTPPTTKVTVENNSKVAESEKMVKHDPAELWQELLGNLNGDSITLGALLAKATPMRLVGDELVIGVGYDFHRQQLMSEKTLVKLEKAVEKIVGRSVKIRCEVMGRELGVVKEKSDVSEGEGDIIAEAVEIFSN